MEARRERRDRRGGEGEEEEVASPRSGIVPVSVVWVHFAAVHEKGVVDDNDGLAPSTQY